MSIQLSQLLKNYPCTVHGSDDPLLTSIEYDSRKVVPGGCLFFCLPGSLVDGHRYAESAYIKGCRAFVVEHPLELPKNAVQVVVDDARAALAVLSAVFYGNPAEDLTLIGVTGTKGKTMTAILIREILCDHGIECGYIGSNGVVYLNATEETTNTTPESKELHRIFRQMLNHGVTHVVMEVSSQALCHNRVDGLHFDTVLFTNLGRDHVSPGEHESFEEYRDAKRRLYHEFGARHIVYNADDAHAAYMIDGIKDAELHSFALEREADFRGSNLRAYRDDTSLGIDFDVLRDGIRTGVRLRTPGTFSIYNGLAAITTCGCYGVTIREAAETLRTTSITGRFEIVDALPGITFLLDYAHNGMSLTHALNVLRTYEPKRLICVFGTVGGRSQERRQELGEVASSLADFAIITSDNPNREDPNFIIEEILQYFDRSTPYTVIPDREEAVRFAVRIAEEGDIVLFAGKGHETYQLINGVKVPFSERALIQSEAEKVLEKDFVM